MKFTTSIVLASSTLTLASMRDFPPQHLARFATDAIFTHLGGSQAGVPAKLDSRQEAGASPVTKEPVPAFPSSSFDAPLSFSPSMPDAGYTPPTYAPSTATEVPGSPAGPAPSSQNQQNGPPGGYGGWGSSPAAASTCSGSSEIWGGKTYTQSSYTQSSPAGQPTGWGWSPPAQASPKANSSIPAPPSTWQTIATSSPTPAAPNPASQTPAPGNGGGFQQGPGSSPSSGPHQNSASGVSKNLTGMCLALFAVALGAALS